MQACGCKARLGEQSSAHTQRENCNVVACSILWMTVFIGRKQRVPVECSVEPEYLVAPIYLD